ncbi:MAG: OsmC family protein [Betaproteobacteria bacterium]|nr:OsmC family protein [Betaproteobacteria bacterium]
MSEHKATIRWTRDGKDFTYKTYSRDHAWRVNGNEIPASATAAYLGNPNRVDPEGALVAALSSCHMLTFLALAANKGFVVESYEDDAVGHVEKNAAGKLAVTRVELRPKIAFGGAKQPIAADMEWLHDKAHKECFIANSVTTDVRVMGDG